MAIQNNLCAICKEPKNDLCVDHNHETGAVRGLLCCGCNIRVGFLELKSGIIDRIKAYLNGKFELQESTCKNRKDISPWLKKEEK